MSKPKPTGKMRWWLQDKAGVLREVVWGKKTRKKKGKR